jgi:hypothetical protein
VVDPVEIRLTDHLAVDLDRERSVILPRLSEVLVEGRLELGERVGNDQARAREDRNLEVPDQLL